MKFSERYCSHCKRQLGIIEDSNKAMKLIDGSILCSKCEKKIKRYIWSYAKAYWNLEDYQCYLDWLEKSKTELAGIFEETHRCGNMHRDVTNGLFYISEGIGNKIKEDTLIMDMRLVYYYDIRLYATKERNNIMNNIHYIDVKVVYASKVPRMQRELENAHNIKEVKHCLFLFLYIKVLFFLVNRQVFLYICLFMC